MDRVPKRTKADHRCDPLEVALRAESRRVREHRRHLPPGADAIEGA
jgi:hypothetical protein